MKNHWGREDGSVSGDCKDDFVKLRVELGGRVY